MNHIVALNQVFLVKYSIQFRYFDLLYDYVVDLSSNSLFQPEKKSFSGKEKGQYKIFQF